MAQPPTGRVRRASFVQQEGNPLVDGGSSTGSTIRIENLASAKPVCDSDFNELVAVLGPIEYGLGIFLHSYH